MPITSISDHRPPRVLQASWQRVRDVLRPPPPLTISKWADANRVLGPSSPMPGLWRTDIAPYLKEPMNALGPDSGIERVVVMKAVQTGFTEVLLNAAGFYLVHAPSAVMIVQPNESMAKRLSRQRIEPLIELCPPLRGLIAKARSKGGNEVFLKTTRSGGTLVVASAQSSSALRSLPARIVLCDEVDSYLADIGEGAPFDLAAARSTTFGSLRRVAAVSTPTDENSLIAKLFSETDQRRYHVPCPECEYPQVLEWPNLRWEPGQTETARYRCAACGCEIQETHKAAMVAAGQWKPTANYSNCVIRGYHLNALISPWQRWAELVAQYEASEGVPERRKTFVNLVLAETYAPPALTEPVEAATLMARSEPFAESVVPEGAAFLTCGCDVQQDRIEAEVVGWGRDYESWSIGYYIIHGDTSEPQIWQRLDELLARSWPHASGMPLTLQAACIDCGFSTPEVCAFTRNKHGRRIFATKSLSSGFGKPVWPRRCSWSKDRYALYSVSADEAKLWLANRLKIEKPGPGYMHFPVGRPLPWYEQLTAERLTLVKGQRRWTNPQRQRNEALDARVLAICALHSRLLSGLDLNAWCEQFERLLAPPENLTQKSESGFSAPKPNGAPHPGTIRSKAVWG